jgi:hypothetical protein
MKTKNGQNIHNVKDEFRCSKREFSGEAKRIKYVIFVPEAQPIHGCCPRMTMPYKKGCLVAFWGQRFHHCKKPPHVSLPGQRCVIDLKAATHSVHVHWWRPSQRPSLDSASGGLRVWGCSSIRIHQHLVWLQWLTTLHSGTVCEFRINIQLVFKCSSVPILTFLFIMFTERTRSQLGPRLYRCVCSSHISRPCDRLGNVDFVMAE